MSTTLRDISMLARMPTARSEIDREIERRRHAEYAVRTEAEFNKERKAQARRGGLIRFVRYCWSALEPDREMVEGWPLDAMCEHLEAITRGDIKRLLINVPPGMMKSLLVDVFWPAWEWGPMNRPYLRYVAFSYSATLTERDNGRFRALLESERYRSLWGERFTLERIGDRKIANTRTGWKLATSVGGVSTGERGDRLVLDDPHNVKQSESEQVRQETVRWFRESMSNRLNDENTAIVVIMQRLHEEDVSGFILSAELNYTHLMIPMEFEPERFPADYEGNEIGWIDPRATDDDGDLLDAAAMDERAGELAWDKRFPRSQVEEFKIDMGPFAYAGQYQQAPMPRKGGIFELGWWQLWESPTGKFPDMDFILVSLDSAFTEREENDPSGLTVWGVWRPTGQPWLPDELSGEDEVPRLMLMHAWRKHLKIHGEDIPKRQDESVASWTKRAQPRWGLCEWVAHTARRFNADTLLIEAKASGLDVIHEMRRLYADERWGIVGMPAPKDKVSRALAVQPIWAQEVVWAPARDWAEMVRSEMAMFPKGRYKDLTDSATHAAKWLRDKGLLRRNEELLRERRAVAEKRKKPMVLYPA
jgi:predicted phage terminase large subunit-like protein